MRPTGMARRNSGTSSGYRMNRPSGLFTSEAILARNFTGAAPTEQVSPPVTSRTRAFTAMPMVSTGPNSRSSPVASR